MRRHNDMGFFVFAGAIVVLNIALIIAVIYVAIHFIQKWW